MELNFYLKDDILICKMAGEIDHHMSKEARNQIDQEIDIYGVKTLIFDFDEVTFMDSSGIGLVLGRHKKMQAEGGRVKIIRPPEIIERILHMSGVFTVIDRIEKGDVVDGE